MDPSDPPLAVVTGPGGERHLDARHSRLFGINARVVAAGTVALEDEARVLVP